MIKNVCEVLMMEKEKSKAIGHFTVLAGLWFVNILIVIFGMPFIVFNKAREKFTKSAKKSLPKTAAETESTHYFPCQN
ncbi:MAG TPA: hypothetical protein VIL74_13770 [Pyrinomonadaceae bacterium]